MYTYMSIIARLIAFFVAIAILYVIIDAFFLNAGLVDPAIIPRINQTLAN